MSGVLAVLRKELTIYYATPFLYVVSFFFLLFEGVRFFGFFQEFQDLSLRFAQDPQLAAISDPFQLFLRAFFENLLGIIFLIIIPTLTMRLLAEEKRSGTAELLFTYPITDWGIILGKFIAVLISFVTILFFTSCYIIIFSLTTPIDWAQVASGYLGILLLVAACIASGLFFSSITQNQVIAYISTFALLFLLFIFGYFKDISSWGGILANLSPWEHLSNMAKGVIDTKDLVFYLCFTFFFLFLTKRQLESRRWRA